MRRGLPLAILLLLLPVVAAQAETGRPVTFLVYHAQGGVDPDPEATPLAPPPAGATRLPATFFDGTTRASTSPENAPQSALAHFREFQRNVQAREATGAPVALQLAGAPAPGLLIVETTVIGAGESLNLTLVVFEHARSPYAARFALAPERVTPTPDGARLRQDIRLDPAWDLDRLGVVAIARRGDEVVQSATWLVRGDGPTRATDKVVLVEHVTASWCDPCGPADEALALLWTQRGVAGALVVDEPPGYLRAPSFLLFVGLVGGAWAGLELLRRGRT